MFFERFPPERDVSVLDQCEPLEDTAAVRVRFELRQFAIEKCGIDLLLEVLPPADSFMRGGSHGNWSSP